MSLPPFQYLVAEFVSRNSLEISANDRLLDLISEVGELAKEYLKSTEYGDQKFTSTNAWADELGDVFFSLICLANSAEIDLQVALNGVMAKYKTRLDHHGDIGSGN